MRNLPISLGAKDLPIALMMILTKLLIIRLINIIYSFENPTIPNDLYLFYLNNIYFNQQYQRYFKFFW